MSDSNTKCPHCGKDFKEIVEKLGFEAVLWHLAVHSGEMAQQISDLQFAYRRLQDELDEYKQNQRLIGYAEN